MTRPVLEHESGFTIVEVLVAAVVFLVGFSILVNLLNSTLVKFSTAEMTESTLLADEIITKTVATKDTTALDTVIQGPHVAWRVARVVEIDRGLAEVTVTVWRERTSKQMIELYDAFVIP